MRTIHTRLNIVFSIIILLYLNSHLNAADTDSILISSWDLNNGNGFVKCDPKLWSLSGKKGGIGVKNSTGYGYYRTQIIIPSKFRGTHLALFFNGIDDADITFFNEKIIGTTGSFPVSGKSSDGYVSAWRCPRLYSLPVSDINYDAPNKIEVKFYNHSGEGGICGPIPPRIAAFSVLDDMRQNLIIRNNMPRIVAMSFIALLVIILFFHILYYRRAGFAGYFLKRLTSSFNPVIYIRSLLYQVGRESFFPHEICFKYIFFIAALSSYTLFIYYELITIGTSHLPGIELLGNKHHIQILYFTPFFLFLALHPDIFPGSTEKLSAAELAVQLVSGLITHPALFLCYLIYIFFLPTSLLYNDFKSRGSIIVITIAAIMLLKEIARAIRTLIGKARAVKTEFLYENIFRIIFLSGCIITLLIFVILPSYQSMNASIIVSVFLMIYIVFMMPSLQNLWKSYRLLENKKESEKKYKSSMGRVRLITEYIEQNFSEGITREDIAGALDMTPEHLSRTFKAQTGKTILDYINEVRIHKAAEMLTTTNKTIIEIAFSTGFNSLRTFNRIFARLMSKSPRQYRNNGKSISENTLQKQL